MKKLTFSLLAFLSWAAFAETWTECKEGDSYPTDTYDFVHYEYSTRVGFLNWWTQDSDHSHHLQEIPLEDLRLTISSEKVESTTQFETRVKRVLAFDRIVNSYYHDGNFIHVQLNPPQPIVSERLFSCIDYQL